MTPFELFYLSLEPFFPPLPRKARAMLRQLASEKTIRPEVLDVGGRMSHYTIGIPANITVTDIPRTTNVQNQLHLGTNDELMERLSRRRSNVMNVMYDDMTNSRLPELSFDGVVAIEVLEHVEEDDRFLAQVRRVLKPGCTFLMSTPNGEFVRNTNPDHKRHYTRQQLETLLGRHFERVTVEYAVRTGLFYGLGLRSWTIKRPLQTGITMVGGFISTIQSNAPDVRYRSSGTHQLVAVCTKLAEDKS